MRLVLRKEHLNILIICLPVRVPLYKIFQRHLLCLWKSCVASSFFVSWKREAVIRGFEGLVGGFSIEIRILD